jgi:hypothetical protein
MRRHITITIAGTLVCALLHLAPALAQEAPTKDSLRTMWEATQKSDPHTKLFRKTQEKDVYDFETDLFPYKGRLKVMNLLVDQHPGYYYEYDDGSGEGYKGVIEVKLLDAPKEFRGDYAQSYETWDRLNYFHYDADTASWVTRDAWSAVTRARAKAAPVCPAASATSRLWSLIEQLAGAAVVLFLTLVVVILATRTARRRQKDYLQKYDESLARQQESVTLQKENVELQKQILAALKGR